MNTDPVYPNAHIAVDQVSRDAEVVAYLHAANEMMKGLGYTEHGERHANLVANIAFNVLNRLEYPARQAELAAISGYLHDAGNLIHRENHTISGAILAREVLRRMNMLYDEIALVMGAIGNHEEPGGVPINPMTAAVILADKADVHTSRVQNPDPHTFDIHDRVNHAVQRSFLRVDATGKAITLELDIDTTDSSVSDYFEIFLTRMILCRRAAQFLGCQFSLVINNNRVM